MGYIFDALNKKNGEPTQPIEATANDSTPGPDPKAPATRTGLADLFATAAKASEPEAEPLRLSDLPLTVEDLSTDLPDDLVAEVHHKDPQPVVRPARPPQLSIHSIGSHTDEPKQDPTEDLSIDDAAPAAHVLHPKTNWWNKLLGRHLSGKVDDRLVAITSPASAMSEEYRSIRTSILARHDNERHLVHTITSATPQEGKTITCVNLGLSFAELRNRKTIIIECDLRLPTFGKLLNCDSEAPGLIDYLRGDAKVSEIIQQVEGSALNIITAGGRVSDEAVQLLSSQRMSHLIQGLRAKFDHVIIDTPPVLQLADAGILGSQSEEVLVVARMRRTPRPLVEQAINTLTSYNAQVNGIIATDNPRSRGRGYGYKYGYRYGYGYGYGYTSDRSTKKRKKRNAA